MFRVQAKILHCWVPITGHIGILLWLRFRIWFTKWVNEAVLVCACKEAACPNIPRSAISPESGIGVVEALRDWAGIFAEDGQECRHFLQTWCEQCFTLYLDKEHINILYNPKACTNRLSPNMHSAPKLSACRLISYFSWRTLHVSALAGRFMSKGEVGLHVLRTVRFRASRLGLLNIFRLRYL